MPEGTRDFNYYFVEYFQKGRSPQGIADEWGTYPNKIRRELKKLGFKLRDKSEAQKMAIHSGRHPHPTKGKHRPQDVKQKISEGMATSWEKTPKDKRRLRARRAQRQWNRMSEAEKAEFRSAAAIAVRESSKSGSRLEKAIFQGLTEADYEVDFHATHILPGETLHTDLHIPSLRTVIEIDGPSHHLPIWGADALKKVQESDRKKNEKLELYGFTLIRIKNLVKNLSEARIRRLLEEIVLVLESIKQGKIKGPILLTLEVTDGKTKEKRDRKSRSND